MREIKDLNPGQTAWTVPWALHEIKGRSFLHPNYSAYNHSGGTVQMKVGNHCGKFYALVNGKRVPVDLAPFETTDSDHVDHETWIEYHDRLVREYYDFDAEWALIKEICPELDKPAPEPRPVRRVRRARRPRPHPFHGVAVAFLGVAALNFMIGSIVTMAVWAVAAVFMLAVATVATATRR